MESEPGKKPWRDGNGVDGKMSTIESFEETYRAYPFRPLVEFGLALSSLFVRSPAPRTDASKGPKVGAHQAS